MNFFMLGLDVCNNHFSYVFVFPEKEKIILKTIIKKPLFSVFNKEDRLLFSSC